MDLLTTSSPGIPVALFAVYSWVFCHAIDCSQRTRNLLAPFLLLPACGSFWTMTNLSWPPGLSSMWGLGLIVHITHTTSLLYIDQVRIPPGLLKHSKVCGGSKNLFAKYRLWEDPQKLYMQESACKTNRAASTGVVVMFVLKRLAILGIFWLIHTYIASGIFPNHFIPLHMDEFSHIRGTYFRRLFFQSIDPVTLRETMLRAAFTAYWLWTTFAMLTGTNIILSIAFVSLRLDDPSNWPYIYGSLLEAYSMRRFWGKFWHRIAIPPYASHCRFVVRQLLGPKPNPNHEKVLVALGIFGLSGASHALCSWHLGDRCGYMDDLWFFLTNFLAATVESLLLPKTRSTHGWMGMLQKAMGYIWVCTFFFWLVPKWQYPKLYCAIEDSLAA